MKKILILCLSILFTIPSFASGIDANATSAPCDNATLETYGGTANVEINWEPNTIDLTWRNGDQLVSGPTTCTYDGALNIPSTPPTRTGYTFIGWKLTVPPGYTELEYIEGGKILNAYINLGFPATPTMQTLLTASVSAENSGNDNVMFGASNNVSYSGGKAYSVDKYPTMVIIPNGNNGGPVNLNFTVVLNTVYQFKINYPTVGIIGVDDFTQTGYTDITSVSSQNLYVFGFNGAGSYSKNYSVGKMKLYNLTLWDNGAMTHNYIPAKRNSDNVLGLWDTVTQTFFINAGTGTFGAGPAVQ